MPKTIDTTDKRTTDLAKEGLSGKVKQVRQILHEGTKTEDKIIPFKKVQFCEQDDSLKLFDTIGNLTEEITYKIDGEMFRKYIYKYDEKGNQVEKCWYNSEHILISKENYKYDDSGNLVERNDYKFKSKEDLKCQTIYKYDNKRLVERKVFHASGNIISRETFKYDSKGNQIERNWYLTTNSNQPSQKDIYYYDENGNKIIWLEYDYYGKLRSKENYKYDEKGNLQEEDTKLGSKYVYEYDDKKRLIQEHFYNQDNVLERTSTYTYECDDEGNWVRKITANNSGKYYIRIREIQYY